MTDTRATGSALLADLEQFLGRFVVYPSEGARVAHTLWIVHAWLMDCWESTPRIAFLSPEPGSGKSRALEVTEPLVPRAVHAVNATPAYLFRKVSDPDGPPTVLFDEIDTIFGPKAKDNEDLRGMLNAGHRKGAMAGRCVVRGKIVETEELPAYCAVALAGLDDLPDTLMTRSVIVRMRRRAPGETVQPWRLRVNLPEAQPLAERIAAWAASIKPLVDGAWPEMPAEIQDRSADVWEPLLAIADAAGPEWAARARVTAVTLVTESGRRTESLGVLLLRDLRTVFADHPGISKLSTESILAALHSLEESPWSDLRGKELDPRGLSRLLGKYNVSRKSLRVGDRVFKGYDSDDLVDPWSRYLSSNEPGQPPAETVTSVTPVTPQVRAAARVTAPELVTAGVGNAAGRRNRVTDVTDLWPPYPEEQCEHGTPRTEDCGWCA